MGGLAGYAVADFVEFSALTSSQNALLANGTDIIKFVPPEQWLDLAVRSQCQGGELCYEPILQSSAGVIAEWDQYVIGHQPEADLTVLINIIVTSLALDFFSLLILGVAILFAVLESRGKLPKKFTRPKVSMCGKQRRFDIFLYIDIFLFVGSGLLLLASIVVAFTTPLQLVPTNTVERVVAVEAVDFDQATQTQQAYYFFRFSKEETDRVEGQISNFLEEDPVIRFRPYARVRNLAPRDYERHVQYIRWLNREPLTADQEELCLQAWADFNGQQLPASCGEPETVDCSDGCCFTRQTAAEPEVQRSCDCSPDPAAPDTRRCCEMGEGATRCGFVAVPSVPPECRKTPFSPPSFCLSLDSSNDPPFGAPRQPLLWSICPYEKISFLNSSVVYNCTGQAVVQLNSTEELKTLVQDQIVQGIGVDAAATGLDGVGALLEHFLMPHLFRPIVLV